MKNEENIEARCKTPIKGTILFDKTQLMRNC